MEERGLEPMSRRLEPMSRRLEPVSRRQAQTSCQADWLAMFLPGREPEHFPTKASLRPTTGVGIGETERTVESRSCSWRCFGLIVTQTNSHRVTRVGKQRRLCFVRAQVWMSRCYRSCSVTARPSWKSRRAENYFEKTTRFSTAFSKRDDFFGVVVQAWRYNTRLGESQTGAFKNP